ncbi:Uncharacterised protein [Klebsiella pneumoniae]|nr:Uncharacterised protein [Klebsiella pneumoniae]
MPAPSQTVFDGFQSCRHPIPAGLSYQHEPAVAIFPADVREPEEVEHLMEMEATRTARWDITPRGNTGGSGHR